MPIDKARYPANWNQISQTIRERAGNKCEVCGVENGVWIVRSTTDPEQYLIFDMDECMFLTPDRRPIRMSEIPDEFTDNKEIRIVLTVAHLDHDTENNSPDNLKCLCQLHHLRHDAKYHAANAIKTRARKRREQLRDVGQKELF